MQKIKTVPLVPLSSLVGYSDFQRALNDLLELWDIDFIDPGTATCELAETIGLFAMKALPG